MREDSIIIFLEGDSKKAALQHQRMTFVDRNRTFWVKTVSETIDLLKNYRDRLDIVSLSYDLDESRTHPANEHCGMEIVRWLEKQDSVRYSHVRFIVHSWNIFFARKMAKRLQDKGYRVVQIPFGYRS